jgi:hypothetical protein
VDLVGADGGGLHADRSLVVVMGMTSRRPPESRPIGAAPAALFRAAIGDTTWTCARFAGERNGAAEEAPATSVTTT